MAIFFGISGGLTAIGPIAGGFLVQWTWWAIFWINIPVAIVALVLLGVFYFAFTRSNWGVAMRSAAGDR